MRELLEIFCDFIGCCPVCSSYSYRNCSVYTRLSRIVTTATCVATGFKTTFQRQSHVISLSGCKKRLGSTTSSRFTKIHCKVLGQKVTRFC